MPLPIAVIIDFVSNSGHLSNERLKVFQIPGSVYKQRATNFRCSCCTEWQEQTNCFSINASTCYNLSAQHYTEDSQPAQGCDPDCKHTDFLTFTEPEIHFLTPKFTSSIQHSRKQNIGGGEIIQSVLFSESSNNFFIEQDCNTQIKTC